MCHADRGAWSEAIVFIAMSCLSISDHAWLWPDFGAALVAPGGILEAMLSPLPQPLQSSSGRLFDVPTLFGAVLTAHHLAVYAPRTMGSTSFIRIITSVEAKQAIGYFLEAAAAGFGDGLVEGAVVPNTGLNQSSSSGVLSSEDHRQHAFSCLIHAMPCLNGIILNIKVSKGPQVAGVEIGVEGYV